MVEWVDEEDWADPGEGAVLEVERELGVRLPADFVALARAHPHASPEPSSLDVPGFGGTAVDCLLHVGDQDGDSVLSRQWMAADGLGEGLVPFATDIGGDLFCFDYRTTPEAPAAGFWSVDTGFVPLAGDFAGFVALLHSRA